MSPWRQRLCFVFILFLIKIVASYETLHEEIDNFGQYLKPRPSEPGELGASEEIDKYVYTLDHDKKSVTQISDDGIYELGDTKDNNINQRSLVFIHRSKKIPVRLDIVKSGDTWSRNALSDISTYTKLLQTFHDSNKQIKANHIAVDQEPPPITKVVEDISKNNNNKIIQFVPEKNIPEPKNSFADNKIEIEKKNMHHIIDKFNTALKEFNSLHEKNKNSQEWKGNFETSWKPVEKFHTTWTHGMDDKHGEYNNFDTYQWSAAATEFKNKQANTNTNPVRYEFIRNNVDGDNDHNNFKSATINNYASDDAVDPNQIVTAANPPSAMPKAEAGRLNQTKVRLNGQKSPSWAIFADEYKLKKMGNGNILAFQNSPQKEPEQIVQKPLTLVAYAIPTMKYQYSPGVESGRSRNYYAIDDEIDRGGDMSYFSVKDQRKKPAQYVFNKRDDVIKHSSKQIDNKMSLSMWSDYIDSIISETDMEEAKRG